MMKGELFDIDREQTSQWVLNKCYFFLLQSIQLKSMTAQNTTVDGDQNMMLNFKFDGGGSDVRLCLHASMHKVECKFNLQKLWS